MAYRQDLDLNLFARAVIYLAEHADHAEYVWIKPIQKIPYHRANEWLRIWFNVGFDPYSILPHVWYETDRQHVLRAWKVILPHWKEGLMFMCSYAMVSNILSMLLPSQREEFLTILERYYVK